MNVKLKMCLVGLVFGFLFCLGLSYLCLDGFAAEPGEETAIAENVQVEQSESSDRSRSESAEDISVVQGDENSEYIEIEMPGSLDELFQSQSEMQYSDYESDMQPFEEYGQPIDYILFQNFLVSGIGIIAGALIGMAFMSKWNVGV